MAKRVLGKGLSAIISSSPAPADEMEALLSEAKDRIVELDVDAVKPNPEQPRAHFDEDEIAGLAESIKSMGLLQPILVRKKGEDYFVIAGERRLRAARAAGLRKIKSIIVKATEEEGLTLALIENIQRTNLNPIEEAKAYKVLIHRFRLKQQDIATGVGRDRATIANLLRLLNLPDRIQRSVAEGKLSVGHAKALLSVAPEKQNALFIEILGKGLSVRAVEQMVEAGKYGTVRGGKKSPPGKSSAAKDPHIRKMEELLVSLLGTKVEIRHFGKRGRIEINYYSLDDFERIIELLK